MIPALSWKLLFRECSHFPDAFSRHLSVRGQFNMLERYFFLPKDAEHVSTVIFLLGKRQEWRRFREKAFRLISGQSFSVSSWIFQAITIWLLWESARSWNLKKWCFYQKQEKSWTAGCPGCCARCFRRRAWGSWAVFPLFAHRHRQCFCCDQPSGSGPWKSSLQHSPALDITECFRSRWWGSRQGQLRLYYPPQ